MNKVKNKQLAYAISAVVLILLVVYLVMSWGFIRNLFYVVGLNNHPAVTGLSVITSGEISDMGSDRFTVTVDGKNLVIHTNDNTIVTDPSTSQNITDTGVYAKADMVLGDTAFVDGFMNEGEYWARSITLAK